MSSAHARRAHAQSSPSCGSLTSCGKTTDIGPRSYAEQALEVEPDGDERLLQADAVDAIQRFLTVLRG